LVAEEEAATVGEAMVEEGTAEEALAANSVGEADWKVRRRRRSKCTQTRRTCVSR
jgi:hypothetical protein